MYYALEESVRHNPVQQKAHMMFSRLRQDERAVGGFGGLVIHYATTKSGRLIRRISKTRDGRLECYYDFPAED